MELIEGDALIEKWPKANKVIANIPYQISSPLIDVITRNQSISYVVILVQEEFAERLVVEWESDRGSLGMCTMLDWDCSFEMRVGPHCFTPSPQVHSRLVTMTRIESHQRIPKLAKLLIRQAFFKGGKNCEIHSQRLQKELLELQVGTQKHIAMRCSTSNVNLLTSVLRI